MRDRTHDLLASRPPERARSRKQPWIRSLAILVAVSLSPTGSADAQRGAARALAAIRSAEEHGLPPARYGLPRLEQLIRTDPIAADSALTINLIRLAEDLRYGRVRPNPYSNTRQNEQVDIAAAVRTALAADTVPELIDAMAPAFPQYRQLREALRRAPRDSSEPTQKIRLTMERLRWLPRRVEGRIVLVNIPAFQLSAFDSPDFGGSAALTMPVIVGRARSTRTPQLAAQMRTVEFRPFWNVPQSILAGELLPAMRKNPRYLIEHDMEIVGPGDTVLGDTYDTDTLDRLSRGELRIRQRATKRNALGAVKFEFPNPSSIFLHDTPDKNLFSRERRDLSHGCIRLADPTAMAEWSLGNHPGWNRDSTERAMAGPSRRIMSVTQPTMVILFYGTAEAIPEGGIRYYQDIYGLDRQLTATLHATR